METLYIGVFLFLFFCFFGGGGGSGGEGYSLVWPIRGCAAGQGMAFYLSGLNRVYDFLSQLGE